MQNQLSSALSQVNGIRPSDVADLNKKEGVLYDIMSKISEMCTVSEADIAAGTAATKNQICSNVPKLVIGNYLGSETQDSSSSVFEDMEDTGCKDLPLAAGKRFFLFGILLPEIIPLGFDGGNLCYAQLLNGNSPEAGTGLIIFAPKLFTANPIVQNLNVPVPGTGRAINAAASLVTYVAVGVSFPSQGPPAIEVEFSNDFWKCTGECKTVKANVYAALKLDLTSYASKKIRLGDISVFFEAKCLIDFDPSRDGFLSQVNNIPLLSKLINGDGDASGIESLIDPTEAVDFLLQVMQNDFAIGIDGKLGITIPLGDWTHGLFRDLDITIGSSSALFRKTTNCVTVTMPVMHRRRRRFITSEIRYTNSQSCTGETGVWVTLAAGGLANDGIMADIQQKILDKFQSGPVKSVTGLLGQGVEEVVSAITSLGIKLEMYFKADCSFQNIEALCSGYSMGVKFQASLFEAYLERTTDGKVTFCFAIKSIYDSCGNGLENILVLLKQLGEVVIRVATQIAEAVATAFNSIGREVAQLAEAALSEGRVVVDKIGAGFENGAVAVAAWATNTGEEVVEFTGNAANAVVNTAAATGTAIGNGVVNGANAVGNAASSGANAVGNVASAGANEVASAWRRRRRSSNVGDQILGAFRS